MIYMIVAAFLLAQKGVQSVVQAEGRAIQLSDFFTNSIFADLVLSLAATLGLYIVASLIFVSRLFTFALCFRFIDCWGSFKFEPWHMITSFLQYLLMTPSYIAVLNVYAVRPFFIVLVRD